MSKKLLLKTFLLLVLLSAIQMAQAQELLKFEQVPENTFKIHGDITMIGNGIVGVDQVVSGVRYSPNDDFNEFRSNDNIKMDYIDIDGDASTISSSSSDLDVPLDCTTILYAGLYWSATYPKSQPAFFSDDTSNLLTLTDNGRIAYVDAAGDLTRTNTGVRAELNNDGFDSGVANPENFRRLG